MRTRWLSLSLGLFLLASVVFSQGSGNTLTYNGSNQYVDLGTTVAANCRTIEFWFKPAVLIDPNINDVASLIARDYLNGSGVNQNEFGFYIPPSAWGANAGKINFYRRIGSTSYDIVSNANSWQPNVWYHVAGVIDPVSGMKLYINGVLQNNTDPSTQPIQPQTGTATDMVAIATWGYWGAFSGNRFYNGDIDEVRFWTTARTQAQIRDNMCRKVNPVQVGLNAYYRFDSNSTTTLPDLTGNGYNGNLVNLPANAWHYSSAPIGDTASNVYPASFTGQTLTLQYAPGDQFNVSNISGNPDGAHIYRVASLPNVSTGLSSPLNDYYGVFLTGTSGQYDIYEDYSAFTSSCNGGGCRQLYGRENNAILSWQGITPIYNNCTFTKANESSVGVSYRAEYILSVGGGVLSVSTTSATCNGGNGTASATITGTPGPYSYTWTPGGLHSSSVNLAAGNYSLTASDGSGCTQTATLSIAQPSPLSVVTSNTTACGAQTLTLTAQASGGTPPYAYTWNGISGGQTYTVASNGNSSYTIIATDANGCTALPIVSNVTVYPIPQVSVGDKTICANSTTTLTANAIGGMGNYTFTWQPGNLSGNSIVVSPGSTTIYTVTLNDGCALTGISDTGVVYTSGSIPLINLPGPTSGCQPLCVNFSVPNPSDSIATWNWNFGDGTSDTARAPLHCYTTAGPFTVSLHYVALNGCSNTLSGSNLVTVFASPTANFSASSYETDIYNTQIFFHDQSTNVDSWQWDFGDLYQSSGQNPSHAYSAIGQYPVTLIVSNQNGCKDTALQIITITDIFSFYAPTAFSPNSDDLNEVFLPTGTGWDNTIFYMEVYDRWGNLVFKSQDPTQGWKVTLSDKTPQDTYVWKVTLKDIFGKQHQFSGAVSLIK